MSATPASDGGLATVSGRGVADGGLLQQAVADGGPVQLGAQAWVLDAGFERLGRDLLIGDGSRSLLVQGYFDTTEPPDLLFGQDGVLRGAVVERLAGPLAAGQVAQTGASDVSAIGEVTQASGQVSITRADGSQVVAEPGTPVLPNDVVATGDGSEVVLTFVDSTLLSLTANARMVIDEFVYAPGASDNSASFALVQGLFVFVSGDTAKAGEVTIETPVSTIGIRGTSLAMQVATEGLRNLVTLLQDPDGAVGVVEVATAVATIILDELRESTLIRSLNEAPGEPLVLTSGQVEQLYGTVLELMRGVVDGQFTSDEGRDGDTGGLSAEERQALIGEIFGADAAAEALDDAAAGEPTAEEVAEFMALTQELLDLLQEEGVTFDLASQQTTEDSFTDVDSYNSDTDTTPTGDSPERIDPPAEQETAGPVSPAPVFIPPAPPEIEGSLLAGTRPDDLATQFIGVDDVAFQFPVGFAFPFAGNSYTEIFVTSNGIITLGPSNVTGGDFTPSVSEFVSRTAPQIAAFWTDLFLNPTGQIYVSQQSDRVTVTWAGLDEFSNGGAFSYTFQAILFSSGVIALSYAGIDNLVSHDALVGISDGSAAALPPPGEVDFTGAAFSANSPYVFEFFEIPTHPPDIDGRVIVFTPLANNGFSVQTASNGLNIIEGNASADVLTGGPGADHAISGAGGDDTITGSDGDDFLVGGAGSDLIVGGPGNDTVLGGDEASGSASNSLFGNDGNDYLTGGQGADFLDGGGGDDILVGWAGNDVLVGGPGIDVMTGDSVGTGADTFEFSRADQPFLPDNVAWSAVPNNEAIDLVTDFDPANDRLLMDDDFVIRTLALAGSETTLTDGLNFSVITQSYDGTNGGSSEWAQGNGSFVYSTVDEVLFYDANGSAAGYTAVAEMSQPTASSVVVTSAEQIVIV